MNLWVHTAIRLLITVPILMLMAFEVVRYGPALGRTNLVMGGVALIAASVGAFILDKPLRKAMPDIDAQATQFWGYPAPRAIQMAVRVLLALAGVALIVWTRTGSGFPPQPHR